MLLTPAVLLFQECFNSSKSSNLHASPLLHPSKLLSTVLFPLALRTISSTTVSSLHPLPSDPHTRRSPSPRVASPVNIGQNLAGGEWGGGRVRYSVERWRRRKGGWRVKCASVCEKAGGMRMGRRGERAAKGRIMREGADSIVWIFSV